MYADTAHALDRDNFFTVVHVARECICCMLLYIRLSSRQWQFGPLRSIELSFIYHSHVCSSDVDLHSHSRRLNLYVMALR